MVLSMTGFSACECNSSNGVLLIELRSVNHRYCELQIKSDEHLRQFEPLARALIQAKLGRGRVDVRLNFLPNHAIAGQAQLNHQLLQQIAENVKAAAQYFAQSQAVNLLQVLQMPGVIQAASFSIEALEADFSNALNAALEDLIAAKAIEGAKLKTLILQRLVEVQQNVAKIKPMLPALIKQYQQKLSAKLVEAHASFDDDRIRQEIVLFMQRIDVDEELSRLDAHISEVERILQVGGSVGKRLDFLMQEMNREANTLGSKSVALETSQTAMQLKILIEQMREQIMNLE